MRCPDLASDEVGRLRALAEYGISADERFSWLDPIVAMASRLFGCQCAAVNLVGAERVFLVSECGIGQCDVSRNASFCAHAINDDGVFVIEDAANDIRFVDNPLVLSGQVRFYAGIALRSPSGHALGALCVFDAEPRAGFSRQDALRLGELAAIATERLELRRLQVSAQAGPIRFEESAMESPSAVLLCDSRGIVTACNSSACGMFGRTEEGLRGMAFDQLVTKGDRGQVLGNIARLVDGHLSVTGGRTVTALRADGLDFPADVHWTHWHGPERAEFGIVVRDLTTRSGAHEALYRMTHYDALTELPNRAMLLRQIDKTLQAGQSVALIISDLGSFADINNTLGHDFGDEVLRQASRRICAAAPDAMLVARMGGDEFAVLFVTDDQSAVTAAARAIGQALSQPMVIDGNEVLISGHSGLAIAPRHAHGADELVGNAELALIQARAGGRGTSLMFLPHFRADAVTRRQFEAELRHASERGEFALFYQPQVALADGHLSGAEALIRWHHPERGLLAPGAFLPALEASPLAAEIGGWVLDTACAQAAQWRKLHRDFTISVNLSASQFRAGNLPALVAEALTRHDLPPDSLELEITENIILDQQERMLDQLTRIRAMGVHLSFDDFGTGFASLNLLRTFPVDRIKIDRDFTRLMQSSGKDRVIVIGLIAMAQQLGLEVIAEGIERKSVADLLRQHRCDKGQGYFYGKPCPTDRFAEIYLRSWEAAPGVLDG